LDRQEQGRRRSDPETRGTGYGRTRYRQRRKAKREERQVDVLPMISGGGGEGWGFDRDFVRKTVVSHSFRAVYHTDKGYSEWSSCKVIYH
jgi:hypothetical protein